MAVGVNDSKLYPLFVKSAKSVFFGVLQNFNSLHEP